MTLEYLIGGQEVVGSDPLFSMVHIQIMANYNVFS